MDFFLIFQALRLFRRLKRVNAGPDRRSLAFFLDVVAAISDKGPSMAVGHHISAQVSAIGSANRDCSAVAVESPSFAGNLAVANEGVQMLGGCLFCWPSVSAQVARRRRVDSPKPIRHAIDPKPIAINHADGLGKSG